MAKWEEDRKLLEERQVAREAAERASDVWGQLNSAREELASLVRSGADINSGASASGYYGDVRLHDWDGNPDHLPYELKREQELQREIIELESRVNYGDSAMLEESKGILSPNQSVENGGIDLNQINIKRNNAIKVQFDQAQLTALEQGGFAGFEPVITDMKRISSPLPYLGINTVKPQELLVKV